MHKALRSNQRVGTEFELDFGPAVAFIRFIKAGAAGVGEPGL